MTDAMAMRPAIKADAGELALLVNIATHGGIGMGWQADERAEGTYDAMEVGRLDMLDETDSLSWRNATIAHVDDEVVGMLLGYPEPDEMPPMPRPSESFLAPIIELEWLAAGQWFISMLAVHRPWRGKGIGQKLLDMAELRRGQTDRAGLALITEDRNVRARQLYERQGFAIVASRPMRKYPDGTAPGKDWLLMVKDRKDG